MQGQNILWNEALCINFNLIGPWNWLFWIVKREKRQYCWNN